MLRVYAYSKCGTCKKAISWLKARNLALEEIPIVERPPTAEQLAEVMKKSGRPLKKLFNTSGQSYRQGGWKEKLPGLSEAEALKALAADGKLIKRPIVLGEAMALVGFDQGSYESAFGG
ncbi:MAG: Spx/MgsR family RNA polymerase-binding regulatory protein [Myxococcota bacterium]